MRNDTTNLYDDIQNKEWHKDIIQQCCDKVKPITPHKVEKLNLKFAKYKKTIISNHKEHYLY